MHGSSGDYAAALDGSGMDRDTFSQSTYAARASLPLCSPSLLPHSLAPRYTALILLLLLSLTLHMRRPPVLCVLVNAATVESASERQLDADREMQRSKRKEE